MASAPADSDPRTAAEILLATSGSRPRKRGWSYWAVFATKWNLPPSLSSSPSFRETFDRLRPNLWNSFRMVVPATILSSIIGEISGYLLSN